MNSKTTGRDFFEGKYIQHVDPWAFASSDYEQSRYRSITNAFCNRRYSRAFEPGCSVGVLTAHLASLCNYVYATDISPTAVRRAKDRCKDLPNVEITCEALPAVLPQGNFDLIVFSEIGYYFHEFQLHELGTALMKKLNKQGTLLAVHWLGVSEDHLLSGDRVHEILKTIDGLTPTHSERHANFRLDRWERV